MKFIPMLFSTDMVQALLNDTKTQTRRTRGLNHLNEVKQYDYLWQEPDGGFLFTNSLAPHNVSIKCPYGKPGDVIWVRETFIPAVYNNVDAGYIYKADPGRARKGWRSSMHMPKSAARIFLEIVDISVEKVNAISPQDAKAEGIKEIEPFKFAFYLDAGTTEKQTPFCADPVFSFWSLWTKINGDLSWDSHPYTWVIKFKKISKPKNFI